MLFRQIFKAEFSTYRYPQASGREALSFDPVLDEFNHSFPVIGDPEPKLVDAISRLRARGDA